MAQQLHVVIIVCVEVQPTGLASVLLELRPNKMKWNVGMAKKERNKVEVMAGNTIQIYIHFLFCNFPSQ